MLYHQRNLRLRTNFLQMIKFVMVIEVIMMMKKRRINVKTLHFWREIVEMQTAVPQIWRERKKVQSAVLSLLVAGVVVPRFNHISLVNIWCRIITTTDQLGILKSMTLYYLT